MPTLTAVVLTAAAAAVAAALLLPPAPPRPMRVGAATGKQVSAAAWFAGGAGLAVCAVLLEGRALALVGIASLAAAGAVALVRRRRARRLAHVRTAHVVEVCESLSAELRAGQPPVVALGHACDFWEELAPVAVAARLGADIPTALRRASELPGATGLREVAGAWQVSVASGATMADAVARVADVARRRQATDRLVISELAAARATASMLAVLPVLVLSTGAGVGGDPVRFLTQTTPGLVSLGAGVLLTLAGLLWIERIAAGAVT